MIRGCGGTLSLVVHAFGPSFRRIPPRASHYSTRENVVLWSSNWALSITIVVKFNSNRSRVSAHRRRLWGRWSTSTSSQTTLIVFEDHDSLPVNVQSYCPEILVYSSHSSASLLSLSLFFFFRFKRLDIDSNDFDACRAVLDDQALQRIFLK